MIYLPERPLIPLEDDVSGLPDESDVRWESVWTEETTEDAAAEDASASMPHLVADTTAFFALDGTLQQSDKVACQHVIVTYGDNRRVFEDWAKIMGIEVV